MRRILVLAEGETEEAFLNRLLVPHLQARDAHLTVKILATKRTPSGRQFKGGFVKYSKLRRELRLLLRDSSAVAGHPSARIRRVLPRYVKPIHGPIAAERIGLAAIRAACPHFDEWVTRLEKLGADSTAGTGTPA